MDWLWLGGEGPGELPSWVNWQLSSEFKVPPEELIILRAVHRTGFWDGRPVTFVRVYDPRESEGVVSVQDFSSLDQHPELILYEGYQEKEGFDTFLERRVAKPKPQ